MLAQELTFKESMSLDADFFIGKDSYSNIYFTKDMQLFKQGIEGNFTFNDFQLGKISSVDIINPLKLIVYYKDTNTVVVLDNRLSEVERVEFNTFSEFINTNTATNAGNNLLWTFNINTQELLNYNYRVNEKVTNTQPFAGTILAQVSDFNFCYLLTESSLQKFNSYGSLLFEKSISGFTKISKNEDFIIGLKENELFFIDENKIEPINLNSSEITVKDLQLTQDLLYIYDGKKLHTFTLTHPKK